jgi:hypothetical protein
LTFDAIEERQTHAVCAGCRAFKETLGARFGWARIYPLPLDDSRHAAWYCLKYVLKGLRTQDSDELPIDVQDRWGIIDAADLDRAAEETNQWQSAVE